MRAAGLHYERRHGDRPDAFQKYNPRCQVPVLLVDGEPVADSTEILRRIDVLGPGSIAAHRGSGLDTSLNGFLVAARWADEDNWPKTKDCYFRGMPAVIRAVVPARIRSSVIERLVARDVWGGGAAPCWSRFDELLDALEVRAPQRGFWVDEQISIADVSIFGQLWSFMTPLTEKQAACVQRRPRLFAYLQRVHAQTWQQARTRSAVA